MTLELQLLKEIREQDFLCDSLRGRIDEHLRRAAAAPAAGDSPPARHPSRSTEEWQEISALEDIAGGVAAAGALAGGAPGEASRAATSLVSPQQADELLRAQMAHAFDRVGHSIMAAQAQLLQTQLQSKIEQLQNALKAAPGHADDIDGESKPLAENLPHAACGQEQGQRGQLAETEASLASQEEAQRQNGETYDELVNALHAIDTAAVFLPGFKVAHEGGIGAVVANIIEAINRVSSQSGGGEGACDALDAAGAATLHGKPVRIAEVVSSADPRKTVPWLAHGESEIARVQAHRDFVRWLCVAPQPGQAPVARGSEHPEGTGNVELRRMLCLAHAGAMAYLDDGEASDASAHPAIDYLRDSPAAIRDKLNQRAAAAAAPVSENTVSEEVHDRLYDSAWIAGAKFGWNCGVAGTIGQLNAAIEMRVEARAKERTEGRQKERAAAERSLEASQAANELKKERAASKAKRGRG